MKTETIAKVTLWIGRVVMAVVVALMFTLPILHRWYAGLLGFDLPRKDMIGLWMSYVLSAVCILVALWSMERLMQNMLSRKIFLRENVRLVRRIQWCCGIVALICLIASLFALPTVLMAAVMGFLCLVVSVVACVLDGAVALREENDLTI